MHGGKRDNAGRPNGSGKNQRLIKKAQECAEGGITPVEVSLMLMRELYDSALLHDVQTEDRLKKLTAAHNVGIDIAPYIHPRLAPSDPEGNSGATYIIHSNMPPRPVGADAG